MYGFVPSAGAFWPMGGRLVLGVDTSVTGDPQRCPAADRLVASSNGESQPNI